MRALRFYFGLVLGALVGAASTALLLADPPTARLAAHGIPDAEVQVAPGVKVNTVSIDEAPPSDRLEVSPALPARGVLAESPDPVLLRDVFAALGEALAATPDPSSLPASFVAKYAGLTDREMLVAEFAVRQRLESERARIGAELLAMGEGESSIVRAGESAPSMRKQPGQAVQSFAFSTEAVGNDSLVRIVAIDPGRHPEFGALQEEWRWLVGHLRVSGLLPKSE